MAITLDGTSGINTPALAIGGVPSVDVLNATVEGSDATSDWTGTDPYVAVITVAGLLATDTPIVDIDFTGITFADIEDIQADWALVYQVEATDDDELTLYATDEPASSFNLTIQVTR